MRINRGIYNNHGHVGIRVFPFGNTQPYYESGFGCWCAEHIKVAEKRLRSLRDEIESGKFTKNQGKRRILFPEAWDLFFRNQYVLSKRSKGTAENVNCYGRQFKKLWPNVYIDEFTPRHIKEDFIEKSTISNSTMRNRISTLQTFFSKLEDWTKLNEIESIRLPEFNPAEPIEKPKFKFVGRKHLETGEIAALKSWCLEHDPDLWVAAFAAMTTLLRHGDLNRVAGQSSINGVASKTGKVILLPGAVAKTVNIKNFASRWRKARNGAGIVWFHWHWLRAQGARIMRESGVPEDVIQEILQHSTRRQTREYIGHVDWAGPALEKVRSFLDKLGNSKPDVTV